MRSVIGIDCGVSGAIAFLTENSIRVWDMPCVLKARPGKPAKREVDPAGVANILGALPSRDYQTVVYVEQVSAMPGQGVTSMFGLGRSYGVVLGVCSALHLPTQTVSAQAWKKALDLTRDKGLSRAKAAARWPEKAVLFQAVKDDGRAEAALLAWYGFQRLSSISGVT